MLTDCATLCPIARQEPRLQDMAFTKGHFPRRPIFFTSTVPKSGPLKLLADDRLIIQTSKNFSEVNDLVYTSLSIQTFLSISILTVRGKFNG